MGRLQHLRPVPGEVRRAGASPLYLLHISSISPPYLPDISPVRYGGLAQRGFESYFGNQSAAWAACAREHGAHACALRFEAHGPEQARLYSPEPEPEPEP